MEELKHATLKPINVKNPHPLACQQKIAQQMSTARLPILMRTVSVVKAGASYPTISKARNVAPTKIVLAAKSASRASASCQKTITVIHKPTAWMTKNALVTNACIMPCPIPTLKSKNVKTIAIALMAKYARSHCVCSIGPIKENVRLMMIAGEACSAYTVCAPWSTHL